MIRPGRQGSQVLFGGLLHLLLVLALEPVGRVRGEGGRGPDPHQPVAVPGGGHQGLKAFLAGPDRQSFRRRGPHQGRGVLDGFEQHGADPLIRGSHGQADEGGGKDLIPLLVR